jgi:hypothetical protein
MSYYTEIEFKFADEGPDFEAVLSRARSSLEAQGREASGANVVGARGR